jgi:hypothetical protein
VAALEQAVQDAKRRPTPVVSVRSVIERYLLDLQATLGMNMDGARRVLRFALAKIVLRCDGTAPGGRGHGELRRHPEPGRVRE